MVSIYVLRLECGKYYVGKSNDVITRYQEHMNGAGSAWTRKYKPIALEKTIDNQSPFEEDKITKEYMAKYGIDNVRGGSYVEIELSDFQKDTINREIWAAKDLCTNCGRTGHFVKDCYATTEFSGKKIEYEDDDEEWSDEEDEEDVWGCDYCDRTFTTEYGCMIHEKSCKNKKKKHNSVKQSGSCYRCGRTGHYSPDCYASFDINGDEL